MSSHYHRERDDNLYEIRCEIILAVYLSARNHLFEALAAKSASAIEKAAKEYDSVSKTPKIIEEDQMLLEAVNTQSSYLKTKDRMLILHCKWSSSYDEFSCFQITVFLRFILTNSICFWSWGEILSQERLNKSLNSSLKLDTLEKHFSSYSNLKLEYRTRN